LRIRKYGEPIGRLTADVKAGAWVHEHNLATSANHDPAHERAWCAPASVPVRALGEARTHVGETPVYDAHADRLYWIDVRETPAIHALELATGREQRWPMREDIGSIAPAAGGRSSRACARASRSSTRRAPRSSRSAIRSRACRATGSTTANAIQPAASGAPR
jgi:hypothetical protein